MASVISQAGRQPLFRSRSAKLAAAATIGALCAIEASDAARGARERNVDAQDDGTAAWFAAAMAATLSLTVASAVRPRRRPVPRNRALFWAGTAMTWTGIGLNRWARRSLGASYHPLVVAHEDRPVAGRGPYRIVRHPMYLGSVVICIGCAMVTGTAPTATMWLLAPPATLASPILVEERALGAAHGPSYREGAPRHRLIPGIW